MIIVVIGGIGSGKTLSNIKTIKDRENNFPITNFKLKKIKYHRLKYTDLVKDDNVNWKFWEDIRKKHKHFSIYLDESHNIIGARSSMSKSNRLLSKWVSQIRKITRDSEHNHLYIITQKPRRIDVNFRELAQVAILCDKVIKDGKCYIIQKYYEGLSGYDYVFNRFMVKPITTRYFIGNDYFKYYDTEEMVTFTDGEEYV